MIPSCEFVPLDTSTHPITGWRCWFVLPHERLLRPIYKRGMVWKPREPMEATCPEEVHEPPDLNCKCGIWATSDPKELQEVHWTTGAPAGKSPLPGVLVVGQIAMWGHCIEHERGWRSSHAYPKQLYVFAEDAELAAALRDKYLVPVEHGARAELLRTECLPPAPQRPRPPAANLVPPAAAPERSRLLLRVIAKLPQGPLTIRVTREIVARAGSLDNSYCYTQRRAEEEKRWLAQCVAKLKSAIARGGHYVKSYGDNWKAELVGQMQAAAAEVVFTFGVCRVGIGDKTAARRIVWLMLARRWRVARAAADDIQKQQQLMKRKRHRFTGQRLKASTIAQRQSRLAMLHRELDATLADLVEVPTPPYREWRRMLG